MRITLLTVGIAVLGIGVAIENWKVASIGSGIGLASLYFPA